MLRKKKKKKENQINKRRKDHLDSGQMTTLSLMWINFDHALNRKSMKAKYKELNLDIKMLKHFLGLQWIYLNLLIF